MTRYWPGSSITFTTQVTVNGVLSDAAAISFKWKIGRSGAETTVTPIHAGSGIYEATIVPTEAGALFWRWDTDGTIDQAKEGHTMIEETQFE